MPHTSKISDTYENVLLCSKSRKPLQKLVSLSFTQCSLTGKLLVSLQVLLRLQWQQDSLQMCVNNKHKARGGTAANEVKEWWQICPGWHKLRWKGWKCFNLSKKWTPILRHDSETTQRLRPSCQHTQTYTVGVKVCHAVLHVGIGASPCEVRALWDWLLWWLPNYLFSFVWPKSCLDQ